MHLVDPKTGLRLPLSGCRSKKARNKCKGDFPQTKRLTLVPKVICRGNAKTYGLRPSGRRNALGSILTRRRCEWFSGCSPAMAIIFRCNTHTAPNYRMPPTDKTHDPRCTHDCLATDNCRLLTAITFRAQRNTTGYYTGYMQKRQPIGAFELKQATTNLKYLEDKLRNKSNANQYHHIANRMLGDLEFRGHVRPITEEFNLASNYKADDACNAEFNRTFPTIHFCGFALLQQLRAEKGNLDGKFEAAIPIRKPLGTRSSGDEFHITLEKAYGYRGNAPAVYHLSPWEFTAHWYLEYLKPPSSYSSNAKTTWTNSGVAYQKILKGDKKAPAPTPGEHYVVVDCSDWRRYISFPTTTATQEVRHHVVMMRWRIPQVPQPTHTPLPTTRNSEEERCRIFSAYLRPWVLDRQYASAHVPHLADIDMLVSDVLSSLHFQREMKEKGIKRRRLTSKQESHQYDWWTTSVGYPHVDAEGKPLQRCYVKAWKDYRCGHVVSKYAARSIQQFASSFLDDSLEEAENDGGETSTRERPPVDTSWVDLASVHAIFQHTTSLEKKKWQGRKG